MFEAILPLLPQQAELPLLFLHLQEVLPPGPHSLKESAILFLRFLLAVLMVHLFAHLPLEMAPRFQGVPE